MGVPARDFMKLDGQPAMRIFAFIVDMYGRKMADELAVALLKERETPSVVWPKF